MRSNCMRRKSHRRLFEGCICERAAVTQFSDRFHQIRIAGNHLHGHLRHPRYDCSVRLIACQRHGHHTNAPPAGGLIASGILEEGRDGTLRRRVASRGSRGDTSTVLADTGQTMSVAISSTLDEGDDVSGRVGTQACTSGASLRGFASQNDSYQVGMTK